MTSAQIHPIIMPKWGLAMHEGVIVEWRYAEGDIVQEGQPLCDIETAKITNEFDAPISGRLARIVAPVGSIAEVGALIAVVAEESVDADEIDRLVHDMTQKDAGDVVDSGPALKRIGSGDREIAYLETGPEDAPAAVVFLHGFGGDHTNWGLVQGSVPETVRTIAFDLPGHGASGLDVEDGRAVGLAARVHQGLREIGVERVHLVAHSFGAAVAVKLAGLPDSGVVGLLLVAPLAFGASGNPTYIRGFLDAERKRDMKATLEMLFCDPDMLGRDMVANALQIVREPDGRGALSRIADAMSADPTSLEGDRSAIAEIPTIIVWGDGDRVVPMPANLDSALEQEIVRLPGVGHMPQAEASGEVVGALLRQLG